MDGVPPGNDDANGCGGGRVEETGKGTEKEGE
jgi:hypothetical protein